MLRVLRIRNTNKWMRAILWNRNKKARVLNLDYQPLEGCKISSKILFRLSFNLSFLAENKINRIELARFPEKLFPLVINGPWQSDPLLFSLGGCARPEELRPLNCSLKLASSPSSLASLQERNPLVNCTYVLCLGKSPISATFICSCSPVVFSYLPNTHSQYFEKPQFFPLRKELSCRWYF